MEAFMSAHLSPISATQGFAGARRDAVAALGLAWRRFRRAYAVALRAETSRRTLQVLDDRMLADIGISRAQAQFEADRRPWHRI
jgi:uncharacterized protein YjiS (DUF1127 family)